MRRRDALAPSSAGAAQRRPRRGFAPRPGVAEPERRQEVQRRRLRAAVGDGDADERCRPAPPWRTRRRRRSSGRRRRRRCRAARTRTRSALAARGWSSTRSSYGIRRLRVLVEVLQVGVGRRRVEVEVVLLDVLAVVALAVGQAEQPLLEDRIAAVPEREREAEALAVVGEAGEAVLAPAVGARARLVVAEVVPGVAVRRCSPRGRCPTAAPRGTAPTAATARPCRGRRPGAGARHPGFRSDRPLPLPTRTTPRYRSPTSDAVILRPMPAGIRHAPPTR